MSPPARTHSPHGPLPILLPAVVALGELQFCHLCDGGPSARGGAWSLTRSAPWLHYPSHRQPPLIELLPGRPAAWCSGPPSREHPCGPSLLPAQGPSLSRELARSLQDCGLGEGCAPGPGPGRGAGNACGEAQKPGVTPGKPLPSPAGQRDSTQFVGPEDEMKKGTRRLLSVSAADTGVLH